MRILIALTALLAAIIGSPSLAEPPAGEVDLARLGWYDRDGTMAWSVSLTDASGLPVAGRLEAEPWWEPLPRIELELHGGGRLPLAGFAGRVLVLDFWATWCEPCADALPRLQELGKKQAARGLDVITVNMGEPVGTARQFFWALNLELPVASYTESLARTFGVDALPTTIVTDRRGRIRGRWNGSTPESAAAVERLALELLDEPAPETDPLADVIVGAGELEIVWSRALPVRIEGMAPIPGEQGAESILLASGRDLLVLDRDGRVIRRVTGAKGLGRLRVGDLDADGRPEGIALRPGSPRIVPLDIEEGPLPSWEAPAPVLDAALLPATGAESEGLVLLVTSEGLSAARMDGTPIKQGKRLGDVISAAVLNGDPPTLALLDSKGNLSLRDHRFAELSKVKDAGGRRLVPAGDGTDGVGVVSRFVASSAAGRLSARGAGELALAIREELLVLDLDQGRLRFRARWPGIAALAFVDLDGDGRDELIVASGRHITVLEASSGGWSAQVSQ